MTKIEYLTRFIGGKHQQMVDGLISIADNHSPSSTFKRASRLAMLNGIDKFRMLGIAKATRKLAIVKRDHGQRAFDRKVAQLRNLARPPHGSTPSKKTKNVTARGKGSAHSRPIASQVQEEEKERDLFRFGNYDWLGEYRKRSMLGKMDDNWKGSDLPLDAFHSCYLFNAEQGRDMTENEEAILKPILKDDDLRLTTVGNDMLSRLFAAKFINAIEEELEREMEKEGKKDGDGDEGGDEGKDVDGDGGEIDAETLKKMAKRAHRSAKKDTKDAEKMCKAFGKLAGDEKGEIFYEEGIDPNPHLNVDELLKRLRSVDLLMKEEEPEIIGIPSGVSFGSDVNATLPSELALPDDLFYHKYATDSLLQHETKAERKIEPVLILMDKSGSMKDHEKMVFSRTVAFLIANKAIRDGSDAHLQFFDDDLHPTEAISLKDDKETFLKELLSLNNGGGTSIQHALETIKNRELRKVILITDGEDEVNQRAKPKFPLITVFVEGVNPNLEGISDQSFTMNDSMEEIIFA